MSANIPIATSRLIDFLYNFNPDTDGSPSLSIIFTPLFAVRLGVKPGCCLSEEVLAAGDVRTSRFDQRDESYYALALYTEDIVSENLSEGTNFQPGKFIDVLSYASDHELGLYVAYKGESILISPEIVKAIDEAIGKDSVYYPLYEADDFVDEPPLVSIEMTKAALANGSRFPDAIEVDFARQDPLGIGRLTAN